MADALFAALNAAHHLNDAMRALQEMQADMVAHPELYEDIRIIEHDVDNARGVVLGTRRLIQVKRGLIDRETGRPLSVLPHDSKEK